MIKETDELNETINNIVGELLRSMAINFEKHLESKHIGIDLVSLGVSIGATFLFKLINSLKETRPDMDVEATLDAVIKSLKFRINNQ